MTNNAPNIQVKLKLLSFRELISFIKDSTWSFLKNLHCNIIQINTLFLLWTTGNSVTITQSPLCTLSQIRALPNPVYAKTASCWNYQGCFWLSPIWQLPSPQHMPHDSLWGRTRFMLIQWQKVWAFQTVVKKQLFCEHGSRNANPVCCGDHLSAVKEMHFQKQHQWAAKSINLKPQPNNVLVKDMSQQIPLPSKLPLVELYATLNKWHCKSPLLLL